jgi:hypothetical protein
VVRSLPAAEIHLLSGKHAAHNRGLGACHRWAEHRTEMMTEGFTSEAEVPACVAFVITAASQLHYSGESFRYSRLMAVRVSRGPPYWS